MRRFALLIVTLVGCHPHSGGPPPSDGGVAGPADGSVPGGPPPADLGSPVQNLDASLPPDLAPPPTKLPMPSPRPLADLIGLSAGPVSCSSASCVAQRASFFALVRQLGVHRIRTDFRWIDAEPTKGAINWTPHDTVVAAAVAAGVDILAIIDYSAPWTNTHGDQYYPPDDFHSFVGYATALVKRYGDRVHRYEIWNEPNAGFTFWKSQFGGDPVAFGNLTTQAVRAIAALGVQPAPQVAPGGTVFLSQLVPILPPGTVPSGIDFMRQSFAGNTPMPGAISAYAFHAYNQYPPRNAPESAAVGEVQLGDKVTQTAQLLESVHYTFERPLWLTEIGWPTANGVSEEAQARWTVRASLLSGLLGLDAVYFYTLYDGVSPPAWSFSPESSFGLAHADGTPKMAFSALQALVTRLGGFRVSRRVNVAGAPGDLYVVELADALKHRAWAAWRSDDGQGTYDWILPPHQPVTVYEMTGATRPGMSNANSVAVAPNPIYVVEQ